MLCLLLQNAPDVSQEILILFQSMQPQWLAAVWPTARWLFMSLALIDFAWAVTWLAIERHSAEEWAAGILRKIVIIGLFYTLLVNGTDWMYAILASFEELGMRGAGAAARMSPGDVLSTGGDVAGRMLRAGDLMGWFSHPAAMVTIIISGLVTFLAFAAVSISMMVLLIEAGFILTAGLIFLAFGGWHVTRPYCERYIAAGIATGVKIMLLYMLVGVGLTFTATWAAVADGLSTSPIPGISAMAIMGSALMFFMVCWKVPSLFGSILSGAPSLTAGDAIGTAFAPASAAAQFAGATYLASRAMTSAATTIEKAVASGKTAGAISGGSSGSTGRGGGNMLSAHPGGSAGYGGSGGSSQDGSAPAPKPGGSGGAGPYRYGSGSGRGGSRMPNDHAGAPSPPRLNLDGEKE